MTNLEGKVALVTGSARGIGKAIAERFGKLGASVVVNYSGSEKRAKETVAAIERLGGAAIAVQADVAKVADILTSWSPTLGVELVGQQVVDFTEADFDRLFAINAKGAFFTLQRAARHIADNGRILYVGSSTTTFATPGHGLYSGSKIAAQFLVEVLAKEIGSRGVTVNSILPTAIEGAGVYTEGASEDVMQFVRSFRPIRRMGTLDDVANAAEYLAGDLAGFISGQHLLLSGGGPA